MYFRRGVYVIREPFPEGIDAHSGVKPNLGTGFFFMDGSCGHLFRLNRITIR